MRLPILALCLSIAVLPAYAAGTSDGSSSSSANADHAAPVTYAAAKKSVDGGHFNVALSQLTELTTAEPQNADAWNLLGFTYRKLGKLDLSDAAYLKVLAINPNHLGALEYQGELFITQGKLDAAKANFKKLQGLCGKCEEAEDLKKALGAAGA